jgi:hypothetical protein
VAVHKQVLGNALLARPHSHWSITRLVILRRGDPPGGPKTSALVDQFLKAGGKFIAPTDDLRAFVALATMEARNLPEFDTWLRQRRPLFETRLFQEAGSARRLFSRHNFLPKRANVRRGRSSTSLHGLLSRPQPELQGARSHVLQRARLRGPGSALFPSAAAMNGVCSVTR